MGKRGNKESSELEFLRGENRQLKKLVNHLKKNLGRTNKELNKVLDNDTDIEVEDPKIVVKTDKCPKCDIKLNEINLGSRLFITCKECDYRKIMVSK